jgi:cytochrome c5
MILYEKLHGIWQEEASSSSSHPTPTSSLYLSLAKKNYKKRVRYKKAYQKSIGWCYYTELSVEPEVHGQFDPWTKRITDATQNFDIKPTGQKKI